MTATPIPEIEGLMIAVAFLWIGAAAAFVLRYYRYQAQADCAMLVVLVCFSALVVRHHVSLPDISTAAASHHEFVTKAGDGFYHCPDCERLLGVRTLPYSGGDRQPCIDCVLPRRSQHAGGTHVDRTVLAADRNHSSR